jgi:hypothetical protein
LRTTQPAERKLPDRWLADFVGRLRRDDLAPARVRGYRYDLEQFLRWFSQTKGSASRLEKLSILDLINYRQHLVNVEALKAATVNRRLKALRRFCRWAQQNRLLKSNIALELKLVRTTCSTRPDLARYVRWPGVSTEERVKLLKLTWDLIGSEFAGRHLQYEMFYAGQPAVVKGRSYRVYKWDEALRLVDQCLKSYSLGGGSGESV